MTNDSEIFKSVDFLYKNGYYGILPKYPINNDYLHIIAEKDNNYCFIEVICNNNNITEKRKEFIKTSALHFILTESFFDENSKVRFDIIKIVNNNIIHIKDTF